MSENNDYKARAATVRGRARARLSAIREERLARKSGPAHAEPAFAHWPAGAFHLPSLAGTPTTTGDSLMPGGAARPESVPDTLQELRQETDDGGMIPAPSDVASPSDAAPAPTEARTGLPGIPAAITDPDGPGEAALPARAVTATEGAGDVASGPDGPHLVDHAKDAEESDPQRMIDPDEPPIARPEDSDLFEIPGAGSGLVWMLHTAGVRTLEDLANADARDLGAQMGMVARLLDLEGLVDFARAARR